MNTDAGHKFTVGSKIYFTLILVFTAVLIVSLLFTAYSERQLVTRVITQQTKDAADTYFDSFNVMMITGTMGNRTTLQKKIMGKPGVLEARIIRSSAINAVFGPGLDDENPVDELDYRALNGEFIEIQREVDEARVITVVTPIKASRDYRGTDCLACHQAEEGEVLGAVRISYSLEEFDKQIAANLINSSLILISLFVLGFILNVQILRRVVMIPIKKLYRTIIAIEKSSDLTKRIEVVSRDEIGATTSAFNSMLDKFQSSLRQVSGTTEQLSDSSLMISKITDATVKGVQEQQLGTDMMATAMNEMEAVAHEVRNNAKDTSHASNEANQGTKHGVEVTNSALDAINGLTRHIEHASTVINRLDRKSQSVGAVLDVIKGIAEQTNLLALNAAIEAARAGESGRGFAVVADEVRGLANKTHESAQEIESMIAELQQEAKEAVEVMETASDSASSGSDHLEKAMSSLNTIAEKVNSIDDLNLQVASAAEQQSKAAEEINRSVERIKDISEKTSDDAMQTASASNQLLGLSNELETMVKQFKID